MNKYERQGYANCILDYTEYGLDFCNDELLRLHDLSGETRFTYKGYQLALNDIRDKTIVIQPSDESLKIKTKHPKGCQGMKNLKDKSVCERND